MMSWLFSGELSPDGYLVWMAPTWQWLVASALSVLGLGLALRSAHHPRRGLELLLMGLALVGVVVAIAQPTWVVEGLRQERPRSAILVDVSRSMNVLEEGTPRAAQVKAALDAIGRDANTEVFLFGEEMRPGSPDTFEDPGSDLAGALDALSDRFAGEDLASVSLISDGIDRSWLRKRWLAEGRLEPVDLPGPLSVYQVGQGKDLVDLSLVELDAAGFAFLRTPFEIEARIESTGMDHRKIPVSLTVDGRALKQRNVTLNSDGHGTVKFTITPSKVGRFAYTLSVPVYEGDSLPGNNSLPVVVRVVRDRLRVLQVCGAPSLDEKFLRLLLKQDPSVDLVSFFILRTYEDGLGNYRDSELSLIEFPYRNLFTTDLWSFDLIVLQNFDHKPYFRWDSNELLQNIADYVRKGGALVMIGGDRSFDLGAYAGTPLEAVLPVRLGVKGRTVSEAPFRPALTAQGRLHPITQLLGNRVENEALWKRLSAIDGMNLNQGLAPGSAALLVHPTQKSGSRSMPVLAVREVGNGRSMAFMGDSSWRWVMAEASLGHGNQAYLRFWKNAMRWLVKDPVGQPVQVNSGRENYLMGEDVNLRVQVRNVGFEPVEGAAISAVLKGPENSERMTGVTDADGEWVWTSKAQARGAYRIQVEATKAGVSLGEAESVYAITDRDPELDEVRPDAAFLKALAQVNKGAYFGVGEFEPALRDEEAGRWVDERSETPLWAGAWLPIWVGLFASAGWWLRRRSGGR
jgi:uncharacterized membrane protein